ncbi:P63C domain-containing protein [Variovorax sp. JS1663]|uniref:P63C domain-containing protein n=1 Tax=Variovorax sp. JS1663 TaxID=1851577 RepID=UPI000B66838E|nr:P63C domain-containing protein [Variovorax sp. JS1663]OUM01779.1 hypothetical protein A8M77_14555 [Variovorax sp. JS1663]
MSDEKQITGRARGGAARAAKLSPQRRSEIASIAARAKHHADEAPSDALDRLPIATHGSLDRPVRIGEVEIHCYVLPDETRVLALRGLHSALGMSHGGGQGGVRKIAALMERFEKKGIPIKDLAARANSPIRFIPPHGGNPAAGYEATLLPDICSAILKASQMGILDARLNYLAQRAEMLQHGFATLGIIALVDEATGFQEIRAKDALQAYLERFIRKELAAWVQRFPLEFFRELYRLKKWPWNGSSRRPGVVGLYIKDLVYERLGPGVLAELERKNPSDGRGQRKARHHQWLTEDIGNTALSQHMFALIGFMRAEEDWDSFKARFHRAFPKKGDNLPLL